MCRQDRIFSIHNIKDVVSILRGLGVRVGLLRG